MHIHRHRHTQTDTILNFTNLIFGTPHTHTCTHTDTDTIFGSFGNEPMQS